MLHQSEVSFHARSSRLAIFLPKTDIPPKIFAKADWSRLKIIEFDWLLHL